MKQFFTALLLMGLSAANVVQAADTALGKTLFDATCVACHGAQGQANPALGAPALAGQQAAYLQRQLINYRAGLRGTAEGDVGGAQMAPMAKSLPDDDAVTAVAEYLASLPAVASTASINGGDPAQGSKLYQSKCGSCHGGKAEGNPAFSAPALAGQSDSYLQTQFNNFKQGKRGYEQADRYGRQMKMMANTINESEFLDVLAYLNTLGTH